MDGTPTVCEICRARIYDPPHEIIIFWDRDCQGIRESARQGCLVCTLLVPDLDLVEQTEDKEQSDEPVARICFGSIELLLDPESSFANLLVGLNRTPLRYLLHSPEGTDINFDQSFKMARNWLRTCVNEHEHCRSVQPSFCPTRLLKIDQESQSMRLCEGIDISPRTRYATLSHCWGGTTPTQLTTNSIGVLKTGIPSKYLSQTFRDASRIALELGIVYIWIDSLCIIQDSLEDWQKESVKMSLVYGNSACNIAAAAASGDSGSYFERRERISRKPVKLTFSNSNKTTSLYLTSVRQWWHRLQRQPLNRRAWVVQERLLCPRNLQYERDGLVWECNELFASEQFPNGFGNLIHKHARPLRVPLDPATLNAQEERIPGSALREIWRSAVSLFTTADITKPTDRLIALHGVGSRIQEVCGWPYVAGMFLKNLQSQLCWAAIGDIETERPEIPIAPSWSWVSANQPVDAIPQWDLIERDTTGQGPRPEDLIQENLCKIIEVISGTSDAETSGHLSTAELHVSGYLLPTTFSFPEGDTAKEELRRHAASLQAHQLVDKHHFKARPLWVRFDFSGYREQTKITWDFWYELGPETVLDLYLMPVFKAQEYADWSVATGYRKYQAVNGLILRKSQNRSDSRIFERCGTFILDKAWWEFWERALEFPPVDGVSALPEDEVLVPDMSERTHRKFTQQNGVLQYHIIIQ